jgi:hypothetical protein
LRLVVVKLWFVENRDIVWEKGVSRMGRCPEWVVNTLQHTVPQKMHR